MDCRSDEQQAIRLGLGRVQQRKLCSKGLYYNISRNLLISFKYVNLLELCQRLVVAINHCTEQIFLGMFCVLLEYIMFYLFIFNISVGGTSFLCLELSSLCFCTGGAGSQHSSRTQNMPQKKISPLRTSKQFQRGKNKWGKVLTKKPKALTLKLPELRAIWEYLTVVFITLISALEHSAVIHSDEMDIGEKLVNLHISEQM